MLPVALSKKKKGHATINRVLPLACIGILAIYSLWVVNRAVSQPSRLEQTISNANAPTTGDATATIGSQWGSRHDDSPPAAQMPLPGAKASCLRGPEGAAAAAGSSYAGAFSGFEHSPQLSLSAAEGLDGPELSLTGWVYLLAPEGGEVVSIQTIA